MQLNNLKIMTKKNNVAIFLFAGIAVLVVVIVGIVLKNTSDAQKQGTQAVESTNSLVGKPLPAMQLTDKNGQTYPLENLKGKNVVLFFNEGIRCYPACWDQIAAFGTDPRFNSPDTIALSVVVDRPADWEQAQSKMPDLAKAIMLFDNRGSVSKKLGLLSANSSMHSGSMPGHTYLLIDKQGIVRDIYDDANMATNNDLIYEKISKF